MSAFVVGKEHINKLCTAALHKSYGSHFSYYYKDERHQVNELNIDNIGQILLDENVRSVMYRYQDSEVTDLPGKVNAEWLIPFKYQIDLEPLNGVQVIKLVQCLEYQSCETEDWRTTEAYTICEALIRSQFDRLPGYDAAEWEWSQPINPNMRRMTRLV